MYALLYMHIDGVSIGFRLSLRKKLNKIFFANFIAG